MAKATRQSRMISKRAGIDISAVSAILNPIFSTDAYGNWNNVFHMKDFTAEERQVLAEKLANNITTGNINLLTPESIMEGIASLSSSSGYLGDLSIAAMKENIDGVSKPFHDSILNASHALIAMAKEVRKTERPATPTKPGTPQPQASRASCLEAAAEKLKGAGYLAKTFQYNSAKPWSDEFDKGFRDYIEAASGGKALLATNPKLGWADVAASFGLSADLSGACSAITSDTLTAPIKTAPETQPATGNPASGETTTPVAATKEGILPKILSYMQNTKIAETVGLNLIAEPRRASILIEAAGGTENAANVLCNKTEGLSEALQPVELTGPITTEWVRRNKRVLQQIVGAINALVSSAVRSVGKLSLLPADRAKAVAKMKSFISQAHQNIQWTKIASKRKDRIRSEVAAEMTVEDRVTARRIKMKESV